MHIDSVPDFDNKSSFNNYIHYNIIRKKAKLHFGLMLAVELFLIYYTVTIYFLGLSTFFMPALIILLLKDIFFICCKNPKKYKISFVADIISIIILLIQDIKFIDMIFVILGTMLIPVLFSYYIYFRNLKADSAMSSLPDYPSFRTEFHDITDKAGYIAFDDEDKDDVCLKKLLDSVYTSYRSEISGHIKFISKIGCVISFVLLVTSLTSVIRAENAETYIQGNEYNEHQYVSVSIDTSEINNVCWIAEDNVWLRLPENGKYMSVLGSQKLLYNVIENKTTIVAKIQRPESYNTNCSVLSMPMFSNLWAYISEDQKEIIRSNIVSNMCFKVVNTDMQISIAEVSVVFILLFAALILTADLFVRKRK